MEIQILNEERMQVDLEQNPKAFVVINPVAGVSEAEMVRETIQSALQAHNILSKVYETKNHEDPRQMIHEAVREGYKLFIAAGGDGTLSAVADGLVNTQLPLVIIPTGTWNALARALDIPLQVDQAIGLLFGEHTVREIDVMQVGEHFAVLNVSVGVGSIMMSEEDRQIKRKFGKLSDLWRGTIELMGFRTFHFQIATDGKQARFRASELIVANCGIIGLKAVVLDPDIRMDDGRLNVCRIYATNLVDYLKLGISMLLGKQRENTNVMCLDVSQEVEIRSREKLPLQADGEIIGRLPARVKLLPKALRIVTPVNSAA